MVLMNYLAELVSAELDGRVAAPIPEDIDIGRLINVAISNHISYIIFDALLKTENANERLSEEQQLYLRQVCMGSILRSMTQCKEIEELENHFEAAKVRNQMMKGARMKFMYPKPELRDMSDIDVLIDTEQMKEADKVLQDMGYFLKEAVKHHDVYVKPPYMMVEAHRSMYDKTVDGNQYDYFKSFSKAVLCDGKEYCYDFGYEDFYVYLMAHMAKHFYFKGCGIRNLMDIYVYKKLYDDKMDKRYLEQELRLCGIYEFTNHMETLTDIWMNKKECSDFYSELFKYMLDCGIYGHDANGFWNKFSQESFKDKEITKSQLKRWYLFPPMHYMAEYYPWLEDRAFLLPVAWGIRAFKGVFKKKGSPRYEMMEKVENNDVNIYKNIYQNMNLNFKGKH